MTQKLLNTLRNIVGEAHVLDINRTSERATHFWDATPLQAKALVRPANTNETAAVLRACHAENQVVVTHGGVTGLVNGNLSTKDDIILSLERQDQIEKIDSVGRTITVGAGAVLQVVQEAAAQVNLKLGLDLGARGSCTIGGNISTNAGGLSVLRYGMAREQVLGLEAVLADGTVISSMNSMMKNNAGYDLKQLFIGSEGTLGIVTRAVLRLRSATPEATTALLAFNHFDQMISTLQRVDTLLDGSLDAFEAIWQPFYKLNTDPEREDTARAPLTDDFPLYAIIQSRSANPTSVSLEDSLASIIENDLIADAVIAKSQKEVDNIWHIREHIDIALQQEPVFTYDISLPITDMENYVNELTQSVDQHWPSAHIYVYGHLADGNLHILIAPLGSEQLTQQSTDALSSADMSERNQQWCELSNKLVYTPLHALGGSVSAEHGIGLLKKSYLALSRSDTEIQLMKKLKSTLDPKGILNRGKIVDI